MKKFFKDNLPKPEDIKKYKALGILGESIFEKQLWSINKHTLSRAIAIGLFWGWMPMFFQMIPAAFCAVYFRANLPLSLAGVWVSNPITMPPMMYLGYEFGNIILDLGKAEGVIRKDQTIPRENLRNGDRVRAYIYDVRAELKGPQIFLSRSHPQFMAKLFTQEVPEIYDGIISIKSVARDPGSRAKICVKAVDTSLDPVGACVGMRGSRVQAVVNELQGEKIDIVNWSEDPAILVSNALSPAEVQRVNVDLERKKLDVILTEENLSKAIGRRGQNVRLATKLLNYEINIMTDQEDSERRQIEFKEKTENLIKNLDDQVSFEKNAIQFLQKLDLVKENVEDEENNFEEAPGSTDDIVNEEETTQEDSGIEEKIDLKDFDGDLNVDIQDAIENIDDTSIEDEIESLTYPNNDFQTSYIDDYSIYTSNFDEIIDAKDLVTNEESMRLRNQLDNLIKPHISTIGKLANRLQRLLLAKQNTSWNFNLEEGLLDTARLTRIVTRPGSALSFKQESEINFKDTVVSILIDSSGSMRGRSMTLAAICADIIGSTLDRCNIRLGDELGAAQLTLTLRALLGQDVAAESITVLETVRSLFEALRSAALSFDLRHFHTPESYETYRN